jgi:O-succinylbenzoic acid--CoA ligase
VSDFADALRTRARLTPDAAALVWQGRTVSFGELAARAARAAQRLRELGVQPGDRVATLLPNGLAFVELLHGAIARGALLVPVNTRLAAEEVAVVLRDAEPVVLFRDARFAALARAACAAVEHPPLCMDIAATSSSRVASQRRAARPDEARVASQRRAARPDEARVASQRRAARSIRPDPLVALLYTSGTTGRPKGVMLATSNLHASAVASQRHLGVGSGDRWLACLPLFHVGGLALLLRSLVDGSCIVLHERFDVKRVTAAIELDGIAFVSLVPTMLQWLVRERGFEAPPRSLRAILLGGAAADSDLLAMTETWRVAPTYGLTEAASQVATRPPDSAGRGLVPLPGTRIRIVQHDGAACLPGVVGEIRVAGPTVMRGYWRRPEESARALAGGWLHTGDLGFLDAAGDLHVLARRTDLIVSGGENVYPAEVEAVLAKHQAVREVAVAGIPDAEFGARPVAWIVAEHPIEPDALRAFCRDRIAAFKIPAAFHFVAALPRNAGGKLLRDRLGDQSA